MKKTAKNKGQTEGLKDVMIREERKGEAKR